MRATLALGLVLFLLCGPAERIVWGASGIGIARSAFTTGFQRYGFKVENGTDKNSGQPMQMGERGRTMYVALIGPANNLAEARLMILSEAYTRQNALIVKWFADTAVTRWKGAANWVADVMISHTNAGRRQSREVTYRGGVHIEVFIDDDLGAMSVAVKPQ